MEPDPKCHRCHGKGWYMIANGPDDCDKEPCECVTNCKVLLNEEGKIMGTILKSYPSKSKPGKEYHILEPDGGGEPYCECWQWKQNRTCSHLRDFNGTSKVAEVKPKVVDCPESIEKTIDNIINNFNPTN